MPGLPFAAIDMIKEKFKTLTSQVKDQETSADGTTTKLLIQLQVRLYIKLCSPSRRRLCTRCLVAAYVAFAENRKGPATACTALMVKEKEHADCVYSYM